MTLFPTFLKLAGRKCLVVGAGEIGASKAAGLLRAEAQVVVVAPVATNWIRRRAQRGKLVWYERQFAPSDLDRVFLAIAATDSASANRLVYRECQERGILCNVVDDPEHCDFFYPALVNRGPLQIAISTSGRSPALARRLRIELQQQFGPEYKAWLIHVGKQRQEILKRDLKPEKRRQLLDEIASRAAYEEFVRAKTSASRNYKSLARRQL